MVDNLNSEEEPPDKVLPTSSLKNTWKWRAWHERETPVKVTSSYLDNEIQVRITSSVINKALRIRYPYNLWESLPTNLKDKLLNNIAYAYTAHLPFVLNGSIHLEFNTEYPQVYSWSSQSFLKFLPAYQYLYNAKRGTHTHPVLKTILNTNHTFESTKDKRFVFPRSVEKNVIIPFTFGKDSFLTYHLVKEIGLNPILFWINDPLSPYESKHKLDLFESFTKEVKDTVVCIDSELETLRDLDEGWFGWEIPLTAWTILAIPLAYRYKAKYIIFSNERGTESFFYDNAGLKVMPDYEQSSQAVDEISLLTQSLSNGNVFTTSLLQGLDDVAIMAILTNKYPKNTFRNLMSCGSSHKSRVSRWCGTCSKCARLFLYLSANGIDPIKEAGFADNMFENSKRGLFNVFGKPAEGALSDAFGLNTEEQVLAFYLCYLRGIKGPLVEEFLKTEHFIEMEKHFEALVDKYFSRHDERVMPSFCKSTLYKLYDEVLTEVRQKIKALKILT